MNAADFPYSLQIQTRWSDNDMFGHVNNVEYYRFFEVAVTEFLLKVCKINLFDTPVMPFAAESLCRFRRPLSWPEMVTAGIRIEHIGTSSVRYGMALFGEGGGDPAAEGHWVHVFVDAATQRPVTIPQAVRDVLERHRA
jgi:acyl-CoA thioester hydrolase